MLPPWVATTALIAALVRPAWSVSYTAASDGNWSATNTWTSSPSTPGTYPDDSNDTATIGKVINLDVSPTIGGFFTSGATLTNDSGTVRSLTTGTIYYSGGGASHLRIYTNVVFTITGVGTNNQDNGWIMLYGTFNIEPGATLIHNSTLGFYALNTVGQGGGTLNTATGGTFRVKKAGILGGGTTGLITFNNEGLIEFNHTNGTFTVGTKTVTGAGTWRVNDAVAGVVVFANTATTAVEGWTNSGVFNSLATWHVIGSARYIDLPGSNNGMTSIGPDATVVLENGGRILELNNSARNALTVNGNLYVRGANATNLSFNSAQSLTVASGGLLGGEGTIVVSGGGQVSVQSGGTLAVEVDGATATKLTVSGGDLVVNGDVNVSNLSAPSATEYLIATAAAITCTPTKTTGDDNWRPQVRNGNTELWLVRRSIGTIIQIL